jgi:hypothetical protein
MTRDDAARVMAVLTGGYPGASFGADNAEVLYRSALSDIPFELGLDVAERLVRSEPDWRKVNAARFNAERRAVVGPAPADTRALTPAPRTAPSCPSCGASPKDLHRGSPAIEVLPEGTNSRHDFYCGRCNFTYNGTETEWNRLHAQRSTWQDARPPRADGIDRVVDVRSSLKALTGA